MAGNSSLPVTKVLNVPQEELEDLLTPVEGEGHLDFDLNDLYAKNGKYTPEQKMYAVLCYMVEGNSIKAGKRCGLSGDLIRAWKNKSSWWDDAMRAARSKYQDKLDADFTAIIHEGTRQVADRLANGDEVITKDGDLVRKKLTGRDVSTILAILYDKRALLRGDPTSNPGGRNNGKQLDDLTKKLENLSARMRENGSLAKPIDGQVVSGAEVLNYDEEPRNGGKEKEK